MRGDDGVVNENGAEISEWIEKFLSDSRRNDIIQKLTTSNAINCEVFIILSLHGAPWDVASYFFEPTNKLPLDIAKLPRPINGVWIVNPSWSTGIRFTNDTWVCLAWFQYLLHLTLVYIKIGIDLLDVVVVVDGFVEF